MRRSGSLLVGLAGLWAAGSACAAESQSPPAGFSAAQAARGQVVYDNSCALCHGAQLRGAGLVPPLTGATFLAERGVRTAGALVAYVAATMPPDEGQRLSPADAGAVTAYLLQQNGYAPGSGELNVNSALPIRLAQGGAAAPPAPTPPARASGVGPVPPPAADLPAPELPYRQREVADFRAVTEAMLDDPPPGDWLSWRRTRDGQAFSPLTQINTRNVKGLQLAWSIGVSDTQQPTPLVHDGVMYFTNPDGVILALEGATGDVIWQYRYLDDKGQPVRGRGPRNLAIHGDKLFLQNSDGALVAVSARTGKQVWRTPRKFGSSSGPIMANGVVIAGGADCWLYKEESCYLSGYDPDTGRELWRTYTIAQPGDPNDASWGGVPVNFRAGGDTWIPGSYDSRLDTFYIGVSQAKPWVAISRGMSTKDAALYTNSTLALDPKTGRIKWWFQHIPGESLDHDAVFERVLVDVGGEQVLLTAGKDGILWKLDRRDGAYLDLTETVRQDIYAKVDREKGRLTYRQEIIDAQFGKPLVSCPSMSGSRNWMASAYSPQTGALFMPLLQLCSGMVPIPVEQKLGSGGRGVIGDYRGRFFEMPGQEGKAGRLDAYDVGTLKQRWTHTQRAPFISGAVATAGGLVFIGDADRYFKAFDAKTGSVVWETRLPMPPVGFPISYGVGNRQFIAVFAGRIGALSTPFAVIPDLYKASGGNALYVFELP